MNGETPPEYEAPKAEEVDAPDGLVTAPGVTTSVV
jgi:hypothetical protein